MEVGGSSGSPRWDPRPVQTPRATLGTPRLHPHLCKLLESAVLKHGRKPWRLSPGERTQLRSRGARFPLWAGEAAGRGFLSSSCLLCASIPFPSLSKTHSPKRLRIRGCIFWEKSC